MWFWMMQILRFYQCLSLFFNYFKGFFTKRLAQNDKLIEELTETANVSFHLHRETQEQIIIRSIPLWFCEINKEDKFLGELKNLKVFDFSEENSFYPSFIQIVGIPFLFFSYFI